MNRTYLRYALFALLATAWLWTSKPLLAADSLNWRKGEDRVDADIRSWNVAQILEHVAASTGWKVYLDPGAIRPVSVKFDSLAPQAALRALLGDLNFLIVPGTNGVQLLYVFRTSRTQATRLISPTPKEPAKPIANELVVRLKPGSKTKIEDLAQALGAKIIGRLDGQNAYLLQFDNQGTTDAARTELAGNPDVASVDYNYPVERPPMPDVSEISGPDLQLKPQQPNGDCQLVIGLIDTPFQSVSSNLMQFIKPSISVTGGQQPPVGQMTHATAMAQTILRSLQSKTGGATSVKIQPVDVYGNSETTSTFDVAQGIVQAVNNGANILNLSLTSTGDSQVLRDVIAQAVQQGIPIFAAAGNEPVTTPTYPAAYSGVTAVTASDPNGQIASYANRGSFVKMIAPGDNVVSYNGQNYMIEGTSTSTAFVSGMAAGLADKAHLCADQAQTLLKQNVAALPSPAR